MNTRAVCLALCVMMSAATAAGAAPRGREARKEAARAMIKKTAVVILYAREKVKENKVYTDNLARAVAHQRFAKRLYLQGHYLRAMNHTRRARLLAFKVIKANKGQAPADSELAVKDWAGMPADAELDAALEREMPGSATSDEAVTTTAQDLDVD